MNAGLQVVTWPLHALVRVGWPPCSAPLQSIGRASTTLGQQALMNVTVHICSLPQDRL